MLRAFVACALAAVVNGVVTGLMDAYWDDDYETFWHKITDHTMMYLRNPE